MKRPTVVELGEQLLELETSLRHALEGAERTLGRDGGGHARADKYPEAYGYLAETVRFALARLQRAAKAMDRAGPP